MIRSWLATLFLLGLSAWLADTGPRPMLGADKPDPKKADAVQAQGSPKAPSAKATDAHPGHHGGQAGHHHPGAKDGHANAPKATADGKCPYCHQLLAAKGHHGQKGHHGKGHKGRHGKCGKGHGKGGFGHHGQKGHHGKCHHGKGGFGHHGWGGHGHKGWGGRGHKGHQGHQGWGGHGQKGHQGWGGHKGHHGKCHHGQKGHHGKGGQGKCHHGKGGFAQHGKGCPAQHKPWAGRPGGPPPGHQGPGFRFGGPAGGFHPPFAPGMAPKMPSVDELFKMFDTNGDGKIDKAEFAAGVKKIREKIEQRMKARFGPQALRGPMPPPAGPAHGPKGPQGMHAPGGPQAGPPHKMPSVAEIFAKLDKNKDGKLTKDEVPARMWEHLSKAGVVKDGAVTKEALESFHKKMMEERAKGKAGDKPKPKT